MLNGCSYAMIVIKFINVVSGKLCMLCWICALSACIGTEFLRYWSLY